MKRLRDKVAVPELNDVRLARIERAVVLASADLGSPRPVPRLLKLRISLGVVAVAAVALSVYLNVRAAHVPLLPAIETAQYPTDITTGPGQSATIRLGDAVVLVGEDSQLRVRRESSGATLLQLGSGSVDCEVVPRPNRPEFRVQSDDVLVTVVGTKFSVHRDDVVDVAVVRGVVSITTSHESVRIAGGERWQGSPDAGVSLATVLARREQERLAQNTANPTVEVSENRQPKLLPRQPQAPQPNAPVVEKDASVESRDQKLLAQARPEPPKLSGKLGRLRAIASSDPARAVEELQQVASTQSGDEASLALYSRAYLLLFALEQPREAVRTALQYERRFPQGREAEDVRWLRVRALCSQDEKGACRAAAHTYLRHSPDGRFAELASRIINW